MSSSPTAIGIVPASGMATRMRGLPKFLLPINPEYETLIERHIHQLRPSVRSILVATRPALAPMLASIDLGEHVAVVELTTNTMSETVRRMADMVANDTFVLVMPDTFFQSSNPVPRLVAALADVDVAAACWPIRASQRGKLGQVETGEALEIRRVVDKDPTCPLPYAWGAMAFTRKLLAFVRDEDPHIGYAMARSIGSLPNRAILMDGQYFDCGTPEEYFGLIRAGA